MAKVPRTVHEARALGHPLAKTFDLSEASKATKVAGVTLSQKFASPGDIAWIGPCEDGKKIVCYYDPNLDPKDCHTVPC